MYIHGEQSAGRTECDVDLKGIRPHGVCGHVLLQQVARHLVQPLRRRRPRHLDGAQRCVAIDVIYGVLAGRDGHDVCRAAPAALGDALAEHGGRRIARRRASRG